MLKKFIFILKLALANYQPILALFYKRFLQHVALFSSKLALQRQTIRQNAKAPGAGQACFEGNQTEMPKRTALFF
ncbi:MAG: hypothetical protein BHW43_06185 [Phascolarctobacterium succinatutens]|uniref:Uncharacterized protein n=1 Tax=Phascolarctobacterium succinatutens TaxID=626940 RepID=A0A1Q6R4W0_9FIRM|nr:MAG: hypothetical protein BHW43_06185 [Phascolarctobacterium succinatutens]